MMLGVYGVANHTPDELILWLRDIQNVDVKDILPIRTDFLLSEKHSTKLKPYILMLSAKDLKRNLEVLNTLDVTVFVFDSALTLWEYEGLMPLDFGESENPQIDGIELYSYFLEMNEEGFPVYHNKNNNYLDIALGMIDDTNSLLRPFMTFVYTLPNSTHQKPIKTLMCLCLYTNASHEKIAKVVGYLDKTIGIPKIKKQKLLDLIQSEEADKYKEAFKEYRQHKKAEEIDLLCLTRKISAYEFRYILSVVKSSKDVNGENLIKVYKGIA